jgi:hypothetical protein
MEDQTSQQFNKDEPYAEAQQPPPTQPLPPATTQSDDATASSLNAGLPAPVRSDASSSHPIPPRQPARTHMRTLLLALLLASLTLVGGNALLYAITVYAPTQRVLKTQAQGHQATVDAHASATSYARTDARAVATAARAGTQEVMATATAWHNFYAQATSGKPILNDSLGGQSNARWDNGISSDGGGRCAFTGEAYHVHVQKSFSAVFCLAHAIELHDFTFQVQMTILKGESGGILFGAGHGHPFYYFYTSSSPHPECDLREGGARGSVLDFSQFALFMSCPDTSHQPVLLTVVVMRPYIYIFINKQYVASIKEYWGYSIGEIGVASHLVIATYNPDTREDENPTVDSTDADVAFTNAQAWELQGNHE